MSIHQNVINYKQKGLRFGYGLGTFVVFDILWYNDIFSFNDHNIFSYVVLAV